MSGSAESAGFDTRVHVTRLIGLVADGVPGAVDALYQLVAGHLATIASAMLKSEPNDPLLSTFVIVNDAYLQLVDSDNPKSWNSRGHFFAAAAQAMRRILVDFARSRLAQKRGGGEPIFALQDHDRQAPASFGETELLALDDALKRLAVQHPHEHDVVMLRFFAGRTIEDTALLCGRSEGQIQRTWKFARAWLYRELRGRAA